MKTGKLTLIYLAMLVLLIGVILASPGASTNTLIAEVPIIEPRPYDLGNPDELRVHVKLNISGESIVNQINASTVLLEGFPPISTWLSKQSEFIAEFDRHCAVAMIWGKIYHLGITVPKPWVPFKVPLTITGLLKDEYGGTAWAGTGEAKVLFPESSPPPP